MFSSWKMVFTEVPVTESVDAVDLPCPSAVIPMPAPLVCVVPEPISDSREASEAQAQAEQASEAQADQNIEVPAVCTQSKAKRAGACNTTSAKDSKEEGSS
jgi:hypothetical protein